MSTNCQCLRLYNIIEVQHTNVLYVLGNKTGNSDSSTVPCNIISHIKTQINVEHEIQIHWIMPEAAGVKF